MIKPEFFFNAIATEVIDNIGYACQIASANGHKAKMGDIGGTLERIVALVFVGETLHLVEVTKDTVTVTVNGYETANIARSKGRFAHQLADVLSH